MPVIHQLSLELKSRDSREEVRAETEDKRDTAKVLVRERKRGGDASLEVDPFEKRRPVGLGLARRRGNRQLVFMANDGVFVRHVIAFNIANYTSQRLFTLQVSAFAAKPYCGS